MPKMKIANATFLVIFKHSETEKTDSFSSKEVFSQGAKHLRLLLLRDRQQSIQIPDFKKS